MSLVLASASPRRLALLQDAGAVVAATVPADVDETPRPGEPSAVLVRRLALAKATSGRTAAAAVDAHAAADGSLVVLGSDTVVALDGVPLGKPVDEDDARRMLTAQSGRVVTVWTGVAVHGRRPAAPPTTATAVVATLLRFRVLDAATIDAYLATGEPDGVAGAFRVQGRGAALLADRHGCWTNVVGLPVCETGRLLRPYGIVLADDGCRPGQTPAAS